MWVADITSGQTFAGWVYAAFVIDAFSRRVGAVGSTADSYDDALAEGFNSLFTAERVCNRAPLRSMDDLAIAVAGYIEWFSHHASTARSGSSHPSSSKTTTRHNPAPTDVDASVQSLH